MPEQHSNYNFLTRDIIGNKPRWIVRWGISVIFLILLTLGITLSLIKYPVSASLQANLEYDRKPVPIIATENALLATVYDSARAGVVDKGTSLMLLETLGNRSKIMLTAPVPGNIYLSNNFSVNSFVNKDQVLGFILPRPNEHIVKLVVASDKFNRLQVGQKATITINGRSTINGRLEGKIDFIGPGFLNNTYQITVKFPHAVNEQLLADPLLNTVDSIKCTAGFTIDTMSYLNYIFRGKRM
ncbi:HlyD family secretion protein [Longitalea luteola]|uniref:HlyD family secretion protein n=1 Tax=Longitalea luteola TaxID=2812563 RepID=UPI001A95D79D|nr:HlyD family secretion protein [Longitalea luteola]